VRIFHNIKVCITNFLHCIFVWSSNLVKHFPHIVVCFAGSDFISFFKLFKLCLSWSQMSWKCLSGVFLKPLVSST